MDVELPITDLRLNKITHLHVINFFFLFLDDFETVTVKETKSRKVWTVRSVLKFWSDFLVLFAERFHFSLSILLYLLSKRKICTKRKKFFVHQKNCDSSFGNFKNLFFTDMIPTGRLLVLQTQKYNFWCCLFFCGFWWSLWYRRKIFQNFCFVTNLQQYTPKFLLIIKATKQKFLSNTKNCGWETPVWKSKIYTSAQDFRDLIFC